MEIFMTEDKEIKKVQNLLGLTPKDAKNTEDKKDEELLKSIRDYGPYRLIHNRPRGQHSKNYKNLKAETREFIRLVSKEKKVSTKDVEKRLRRLIFNGKVHDLIRGEK